MPPSIQLRLLGPLTVEIEGGPVRIGMGNERALVALLALHAPKPVSSERIVDALWRDPPASAREMVRIYVARIRKHLDERIATHPGGYALEVDPEDVDALRFERLGSEAAGLLERGDAQAALQRFDDALELWTGEVLPELPELPFVDEARGRLEEARLTAVEGRIAAHLALGRSATLIPELEGVVHAHPFREGLRGQLMRALYRAGRQTEALEHYQEARRLLVETAGVEPGPDLRRLQKGILEHDPALRSQSAAEQDGSPPRPRRRIAWRPVAVLSIALVVLTAGAFAVFHPGSTTHTIGPSSLGRLGADGRTTHLFRIGGPAGPVVGDGTRVWVGDGSRQALLELDAKRLQPIHSLHLPSFPYRLVLDGNAVWASVGYTGTIARIDAHGLTTLRPEPRSTGRVQLASDGSALWTASQDGVLVELQPSSLRGSLLVRHAGRPEALIAAFRSVWLAEATSDELLRIVPRARRDAQRVLIPIGGVAENLAAGKRSLWALTPLEDRLWRVDPRHNVVTAAIDVGPHTTSLAILGNTVWIGTADGRILAVDPRRNQVVRTIQAGGPIDDLTRDGRSLLVATR